MLLLYSFKLLRISKLEKSVYVNVKESDSERDQEEVIIRSFKLGRYAVRELNFQGFERSDIQCG